MFIIWYGYTRQFHFAEDRSGSQFVITIILLPDMDENFAQKKVELTDRNVSISLASFID